MNGTAEEHLRIGALEDAVGCAGWWVGVGCLYFLLSREKEHRRYLLWPPQLQLTFHTKA